MKIILLLYNVYKIGSYKIMISQNVSKFLEDPYPEIKNQLLVAMTQKNPNDLALALKTLDRKVPPGRIPEGDKELCQKAREMQENLDKPKRMIISDC